MSPRIVLSLLLATVATGCAHVARPDEQTPYSEHVYSKPLDVTLARTRALLEERGHAFVPVDAPDQLLTDWWTPPTGDMGAGRSHRYLVVGIHVGARRSVVRIFREERAAPGTDAEARGPVPGTRDRELERQLMLRLESRPGGEVVLGHLVEPVEPLEPRVGTRDAEFYLERWKHADPALDALCPRTVKGLHELLRPGRTFLVGEQLGSREAPAVVGDMVCEGTEAGLPLALGLSIPRSEQERINQYLASPGVPADQDELLRGPFWQRPYQDGRSSRAILDLIDRARALRALGRRITVVAYDVNESPGSQRDALMAEVWLKRREAKPEELFLVLAGNAHVRTVKGAPWDADFTPLGWHLRNADPTVKALDLSYARGKRWGCNLEADDQLRCAIIRVSPGAKVAEKPGLPPYIRLFSAPSEEGYDGLLYVGALSASSPATSLTREEETTLPASMRAPSRPPPSFWTPRPQRNPSPGRGPT